MKQEPNAFCESSLFPTRAYSYSDNTQLYLRRLSKIKTGECAVLLAPQKTKQNNKTTRKTFGGYITVIMEPAPGATESELEQPPLTLRPDPHLKKKCFDGHVYRPDTLSVQVHTRTHTHTQDQSRGRERERL